MRAKYKNKGETVIIEENLENTIIIFDELLEITMQMECKWQQNQTVLKNQRETQNKKLIFTTEPKIQTQKNISSIKKITMRKMKLVLFLDMRNMSNL